MTGNATPQPNGHPTRPEHGAARHPEHDTPMYVRRRGLYLPTGTADATDLRGHLSAERDVVAVNHEHEWVRLAQSAQHDIRRADVAEAAARSKRSRRQRAKDATEAAKLADLYRSAKSAGARARVRADMYASAEMRALRIAKIRKITLAAGIPVLLAFAAWSTTGVQAGVVKLLHLDEGDPSWWTAWGVEPALIAVVALIILGRAVLRSSGGDTDGRAGIAEWTALSTSLALNIFGGWTGGWAALGGAVAHSLGPLGAAGTAFLIGLFDTYIARANPYDGAQRLADLGFDAVPDTHADAATPVPQLPPFAQLDRVSQAPPFALPTDGRDGDVLAATGTPAETVKDATEDAAMADADTATEAANVADTEPASAPPTATPPRQRRAANLPATRHAITATVGVPEAAKKLARVAAKYPDAKLSELARRAGMSERSASRHMPAARAIVTAMQDPDGDAKERIPTTPFAPPRPHSMAVLNGNTYPTSEESK